MRMTIFIRDAFDAFRLFLQQTKIYSKAVKCLLHCEDIHTHTFSTLKKEFSFVKRGVMLNELGVESEKRKVQWSRAGREGVE